VSERPLLRVVRGNPDDVELAALTAVVAARASAPRKPPTQPKPSRRSWWSDRTAVLRCPVHPGEGAWRASALPR
jgi:hypothetical protein